MISRETSVMLCTLLACVLVVPGIMAYSTGAGDEGCDDMTPRHTGSPQTGRSNYAVDVSSTTYTPGQQITVTISAEAGFTFQGFLAQGRSPGTLTLNPAHVGTFIVAEPTIQTKDCSSAQDSVTHTSDVGKTSQTFIWVAPASDQGPVVIRVTFVRSYMMYWVGQMSRPIRPQPEPVTEAPTTPRPMLGGTTDSGSDADADENINDADGDDDDDDNDDDDDRSCRKETCRSARYRPRGSGSKSGCPDSTYCCVDHVAFGYKLTRNITSRAGDLTVKYKSPLTTNVGNAYNKATGVFSAPVSGLYNFHITAYLTAISMEMSDTSAACLMHNAATTVCVSGNQMGVPYLHTAITQMLPLKLRRGDQVYVVLKRGGCMFGWATFHSSFTGLLVHPDCDED